MDGFITSYTSFVGTFVTGVQHLGVLSIPVAIVIVVIVNWLGGVRAIQAVGGGIAVVAILNIILANVAVFATWISSLPHG